MESKILPKEFTNILAILIRKTQGQAFFHTLRMASLSNLGIKFFVKMCYA